MYLFLIPLLTGFLFNWASAFTEFYSRRFGERGGRLVNFITRNILGIPVWVVGLIMAFRESAPTLFRPGIATNVLGWLLVAVGPIPIILGLWMLGWRSFRPAKGDSLVSRGIYRFVRHPIYSGVLLEFLGGALLHPTWPAMLACALGSGYVYIQARLEEWDLVRRVPGYSEFMNRVPRFFPRI